MKAIFCESCGDIVAPASTAYKVRFCACLRHAVWWRDPSKGELSVYDAHIKDPPHRPAAYVIGLHNSWLTHPSPALSAGDYEAIIEATPEHYIFKTVRSVAIRIRPGHSSDTRYDDLPAGVESKDG